RGRLLGQIVPQQFEPLTFQVSHRVAAARSTRLEVDLESLAHFRRIHHAAAPPPATGSRRCGACSTSISCTSGVQLPPQWPVVAVVRVAIWVRVCAPSPMARSIVLYLMLLQRQTVFSAPTRSRSQSSRARAIS